ncbi:MAG: carboxypeptidase-like regulatory domain-containing protein, partial [Proteobacteria bacterium]|nr:carboxypeptidase-like regulatory domain-containing protein [Pseudomonadota bacterium]
IDNIPGAIVGNDYYIDMTPATVSGAGVADLSGNAIAAGTTFRMPINNSFNTQGMLGPMMGGGGMMGPDMGMMGMMGAGVFPMNAMAGQTTIYFVDIPTTKIIPSGGKIVLTFPVGFDVTAAAKDTFSPVNNDINEWNTGIVTIASVVADQSSRKITITTGGSDTQLNDFLHMDIKGIVNSSIPRGFDTSGYSVDMKTMDNNGNLLETITGMPFFINAGGSSTLTGNITGIQAADVDGTGDTVMVFLGSPMTGPMESIATIADAGTGSYSFSGLVPGQYMIFTDPTITLDTHDYEGMPMPQPIAIAAGANTKNIALVKAGTGAVAAITVNITGVPNGDNIDVFAGSPTGFKVKTLTGTGSPLSAILYLPSGNWMVGMGPAMPKGPMAGPPPMPDWMPPMPNQIVSNGSTSQIVNITIASASMQIIGYVQDGAGNAIADAEAFAYQPMGTGMGAHGKTDTNGKFTLKVATAGTYSVGVFKPGLPGVPDKTVKVANPDSITGGDTDGNTTADITTDGALITATNKFIFKIQKPDYTISGKVTNGTNPVSYAPVWAYQPNGMGHADTMTDASGNYILYVANGNWTVQSYIPGYGDSEPKTVVVNGASMTQNLSPNSSVTYYTISGTVTLNDINQTYMPIRAVKYDDNGNYTGQEYGGQTDASGVYSISIPPGKYRVDIWTPEFGEVELTVTDEAVNNPANVIITNANKTGKDITITSASLKTITLAFTNGSVSQTAIINIDGVSGTPPKPTGFNKTIKLSTSVPSSSVKLPDGDYMFYINVPGSGGFTPTGGNPVTVSADATVTFVLPDGATELFTVSGKITGPGNIEGAWVWMGSPTTGVHLGDATDSNGDYTITLKAGTYKMGVEMPGFIPQTPTSIVVSADAPATDYTLTAANQFITGRIYADANSNNSYDSGEAVANGWVWVEETTTKKIAGAPTALDGVFSIGVGDGTYILRGAAEGYAETKFGSPVTTSGLGASNKNIKLTVDANWSSKLKSKPMTPASGGTMDDSLSAGTGVKLVVPPNALGSGTSSGNIKTNEVSSVSKTSSAQPLGGKGKEITAQNNSGQAITTLNSDIEIELNYYKEDITEAGLVDFTKLKTLTNSYWDTSIGDWVPISTTKKAYTKAVGAAANAEWTTQTNFDTFADALAGNANTYGDYKITLKSTTGHLTIFGATTPSDLIAPAAPAG